MRATRRRPVRREAARDERRRLSARRTRRSPAAAKSRVTSASTHRPRAAARPRLATITGSTRVGQGAREEVRQRSRCSARVEQHPGLRHVDAMSSKTASSSARMKAGGTSWIAVTAAVFLAVSANDRAHAVGQPAAAKAFRSAWIPAPPPESEDAIVSAREWTCAPFAGMTGSGSTGVISALGGAPGRTDASERRAAQHRQ